MPSQGPARKVTIFIDEDMHYRMTALHDALTTFLLHKGVAGATARAHLGILGYGAKGQKHKKNFLHVSRDLPMMLSVVDTPEKIRAAAKTVEGMLEEGLLAISDVDMVRATRRGMQGTRRSRIVKSAG